MERLVANRLLCYLETHNILTKVQTGFLKKRSTVNQTIRLQDTINRNLRNRNHTLGIFLDFEKAFDIMWRTGLMIKLKSYGIHGHMYDWIRQFLTNRTIQVCVGNSVNISINGKRHGARCSYWFASAQL